MVRLRHRLQNRPTVHKIMQCVLIAIFCVIGVVSYGRQHMISPDDHVKILGGTDTWIKKHAFQVGIYSWGKFVCGGSVLDEITILTAAHCTTRNNYTIAAGVTKRSEHVAIIGVIGLLRHPRYNMVSQDFDIALLRLREPLIFSESIQPVVLPESLQRFLPGTNMTVTGWGDTSENGGLAEHLQMVVLPIIDQRICSQIYPMTSRMFCAGYFDEGGKDSCQGDSGGPGLVDGVQYGIVSWGVGCGRPKFPGVYTNVAVLREWIRRNTGV